MSVRKTGEHKKKLLDTLEEVCIFPSPSYEEWREITEASLKGASFEQKLITKTYEGISLQPMYQRKDVEGLPHLTSMPGHPPYVRGTKPVLEPNKPWEVAQELWAPTAGKFNEIARHDLARGQTTLQIKLDRPTIQGLELGAESEPFISDDGLSVATLADLIEALAGIDLTQIPLSIYAGPISLPMFSLVMAYAQEQQLPTEKLSGCIGADPIGELVQQGSLPYTMATCLDLLGRVTSWANQKAPLMQTIIVQGEIYQNGGGNAVQELAFSLATGVEYIRALQKRGLGLKEIAPNMRFSFAIGSHMFMEIAKLRAARMLWSQIIEAFGGDQETQKMIIHTKSSSWNKTSYDPYVNMLRTTVEAFAATVGGADSQQVSPYDEPIQPPTSFSRRIARNTQLILQEEALMARQIDPAGGSWYIEYLTDSLARKAWELFQGLEGKGGFLQALQEGYPQSLVEEVADQKRKNIEHRKDVFVGTNMYANIQEKSVLDQEHVDEWNQLKKWRRQEIMKRVHQVENMAFHDGVAISPTPGNQVVERAIDAIRQGVMLHQFYHTWRDTDPESSHISIKTIPQWRATEGFEELRRAAEQHMLRTGSRPQVFLASLGAIPEHKARTDFASGFFEVGGFQVLKNDGYPSVEMAISDALQSKANIVVICSSDENYKTMVPALVRQLKEQDENLTILLAGLPSQEEQESYTHAGLDGFIHLRSNCYKVLKQLQVEKGVATHT